MTVVHLGDWSNHDGGRAPGGAVDFAAMAADGIRGGWHKSSDGLNFYLDPYWPGAIGRMRSAFAGGIYGAYHVLWGNRDIVGQVDWWFATLDRTAPGWRNDQRFSVMTDDEPFGYNGRPTIDQVNAAGDYIRTRTGKVMAAYCPPWTYGGDLARLRYPLVSSNYGTNPAVHYPDAYPGGNSTRWAAARPVDVLQYGSRTWMGIQTTCDADAYRGTITQLIALLGGGPTRMTEWTDPCRFDVAGDPKTTAGGVQRAHDQELHGLHHSWFTGETYGLDGAMPAVLARVAAQVELAKQAAIDAKTAAESRPATLTDADRAAIVAELQAGVADTLSTVMSAVDNVLTAVTAVDERVTALRKAEADAARAEATKLDPA